MNTLEYVLGEVCKVVFPISEEVYLGRKNSEIAVCTLSSINLLRQISNSDLLQKIAIVGRLLSENKGIDSLVRHVNANEISTIVLCGKEVWGHKAGHSLLALHKFGIDDYGQIINSQSPDPVLEVTQSEVQAFQNKVKIIDRIGETDLFKIKELIDSIKD